MLAEPLDAAHPADLDTIEPGSALYQALGDPVMFSYGLAPVLVNSVLIPKSARGVEEHERLVNGSIPDLGVEHIIGRLTDTIDLLFGAVFAGGESKQAAHALHELHRTVTGKMPDGAIYHAWNKDTWRNTWFVQVRAFMDVYGVLRGFDNEAHRFAVYRGFVELGRQFRVSNMPNSLEDFDAYWEHLVESTLADSDSARFLIAQTTQQLLKPTSMRWIPISVWGLITLPLRRAARVGILIVLPERFDARLGIKRSRFDRLERGLHATCWKLVPRRLTSKLGPAYFRRRRSVSNPVWRTRYSPDALDARRQAHEKAMSETLLQE